MSMCTMLQVLRARFRVVLYCVLGEGVLGEATADLGRSVLGNR